MINNGATITIQSYYTDDNEIEYEAILENDNANSSAEEVATASSSKSVRDVLEQLSEGLTETKDYEIWKERLFAQARYSINEHHFKSSGVYIVRDENDEIIYAGMTTNSEKRFQKLIGDRGHQFWGKFIKEQFITANKFNELNLAQRNEFNEMIQGFTYSFIELPENYVKKFEDYLIDVYKPDYND